VPLQGLLKKRPCFIDSPQRFDACLAILDGGCEFLVLLAPPLTDAMRVDFRDR